MSKVNIKPLADRVLIEPAAAETKLPLESSFLILQKKNRRKVQLLLLVQGQKNIQ